jgi:hypothetical protein
LRLNKLVQHTASSLDREFIELQHYARVLREGDILTSGEKGWSAPAMTFDDKIKFFIAVNGIGTARLAATEIKYWIKAPWSGPDLAVYPPFRCLHAHTLKDALTLMFEDIKAGTPGDRDKVFTVRFEVDAYAATINLVDITRNEFNRETERTTHWGEFGEDMGITLGSKLVRDVYSHALYSWGKCLVEDAR